MGGLLKEKIHSWSLIVTEKPAGCGGKLHVLIHAKDLHHKEDKGKPAWRERCNCKVVEERPDAVGGHCREDEDGGARVEDEVEDKQGQLQSSTTFPSCPSEDGGGEGLSKAALN